jgi:acyl-CoA thioester hydrolase
MEIPEGFSTPGEARSPLTILQPVAWGELDAYGHVNNANYLRWFETARFHYFELTGIIALHEMERKGPILARSEVDYLAPVGFPDELLVNMRISKIGNSSLISHNEVWSTRQGRLCARSRHVIVMVDYGDGYAKIRVPEPIRAAIRALEGPQVEQPA